jgi:DNA polymerase
MTAITPMTTLYLDFETRCLFNVKKVGAYRYTSDPSCAILIVVWAEGEGLIHVEHAISPGFRAAMASADRVVAHNVGFDRLVAERIAGIEIPISRWDCTAARSRAAGLPGDLDGAAEALKLRVRKDPRGEALITKLCMPRPNGTFLEDPVLLAELDEYAVRDVDVLRELDKRLPPLCAWERPIFEYDALLNDRGVGIDLRFLAAAQQLTDAELLRINTELKECTGGAVTSVNQRDRLLKELASHGCITADLKKGSVQRLLSEQAPASGSASAPGLAPQARQLLQLRQDGARSSLGKLKAIAARQVEGRLQGSLLYYGGHTGRHSSIGAQLQNLSRPEREAWEIEMGIEDILERRTDHLSLLYGSPTGLLADAVRGLLVPAAGHVFEVADYNAIELRGAAWLAGETWVLEALKAGEDVYCRTASAVYGKTITTDMEKERFLGKTLELAGQYGMGVDRFIATCAAQGLEISRNFAEHAIQSYRATHARIVAYWRALEGAAWQAIRKPGEVHFAGKVGCKVQGAWLLLRLPAGRCIRYLRPGITSEGLRYWGVDSRTHKFGPIRMWGSLLFENVVQGMCRDLLMDGCKRAEASGRRVVLIVHDEIVAEVEERQADIDGLCALLGQAPAWAKDLPLRAKGAVLNRYQKLQEKGGGVQDEQQQH